MSYRRINYLLFPHQVRTWFPETQQIRLKIRKYFSRVLARVEITFGHVNKLLYTCLEKYLSWRSLWYTDVSKVITHDAIFIFNDCYCLVYWTERQQPFRDNCLKTFFMVSLIVSMLIHIRDIHSEEITRQ